MNINYFSDSLSLKKLLKKCTTKYTSCTTTIAHQGQLQAAFNMPGTLTKTCNCCIVQQLCTTIDICTILSDGTEIMLWKILKSELRHEPVAFHAQGSCWS